VSERVAREKEMELGVCDFHFGTLSEIGVFPISIVGTSSIASERKSGRVVRERKLGICNFHSWNFECSK
jgi:hypothetical protein